MRLSDPAAALEDSAHGYVVHPGLSGEPVLVRRREEMIRGPLDHESAETLPPMTLDQPNVHVRAHVLEVAVPDDADTPCPGEVDPVGRIAAVKSPARISARASSGVRRGRLWKGHLSAASHSASDAVSSSPTRLNTSSEDISASNHAAPRPRAVLWL